MKHVLGRMMALALAAFVATAASAAPAPPQALAPTPTPAPVGPAVGAVLQPFDAPGLDGTTTHVAFPKGTATVLLFFLSGCPTCHKMIPEWNRAFEHKPKGLQVVAVLMDQEPPGFFAATPISFPVVRSPGREFLQRLNITRAPVTLRVAGGGKVEDVGLGLLDPIRLGELFHP